MSLSRISCMIIQSRGDDVRAAAGKEGERWAGWCDLWKGNQFDHHIFNTRPIFDSEADAVTEVEKIIEHVRRLTL